MTAIFCAKIFVDMIVAIILLSLGTIASAFFIASKVINYSFKTIILKTIASLFFVSLGIYCFVITPGHFAFRLCLLLGLIFGLLGDVLLGFKYITTKTKGIWILAGMFAFAFGHISYLTGLFIEYYVPGHWWFILLPFVTSACICTLYMVVSKKIGINFGKGMLLFGLFYLCCLTSMVSTAFYMALLHGFSIVTSVMFFVCALFFCASDFMLTGAYFLPGQRPKYYMALYSVFYYIAQFGIAFAIFFLV